MWPEDRRKELEELSRMLYDASNLNAGNKVIEKMERLIDGADKLTTSDRELRRTSFLNFLNDEATKEN